jgi:hypothetical protein
MRTRTALVLSLSLVAAAGSASPALAGKKPAPVKKEYTASANVPGGVGSQADSVICSDTVAPSVFDATFKAPFAGRLNVKQDGFQGDWDLALVQDGANSAESAQDMTSTDVSRPEEVSGFKLKKGEEVTIRSCNFVGGPTAHVAYTFTAL